jgi:hypothetical protein
MCPFCSSKKLCGTNLMYTLPFPKYSLRIWKNVFWLICSSSSINFRVSQQPPATSPKNLQMLPALEQLIAAHA